MHVAFEHRKIIVHCILNLQQEGQIANMENRNYFSLHCLQMETQLIHANLEILYDVLGDMAGIQAKSHTEVR